MNRQILAAGSATLLLFAATLAVIPAIAEEQNTTEKVRPVKERPHRPITIAAGFGGAVEEHGNEIYRSHIRLAAEKSNDATQDTDYIVKRGALVIGHRDRADKYEVVPDTWTFEIRGNENAFSAEGKVQDIEGNQYSVSLSGKLLDDTQNGNLYFVEGKFSGDSEDSSTYKLYYLMIVHDKMTVDKRNTRE